MTEKNSKPNLKKLQGAKTRKKLYESAQKLFTKKDFAAVSVEDITRTAGVTKGTFYVHFESKDALIASFISDYTAGLDLDYKAFLDSLPAGLSASGRIIALTGKIADMLTDTVGYEMMRTVYQIQLTRAVDMEKVMGYGRSLYTMFNELLEQGIRQGEFKTDMPIDVLSRHFVMAIRGICYEWCIRYPDFDLKEQALSHLDLLLQGILAVRPS